MEITSNKRILKNSVFLYLRMLILMFISFYTSRVVLNALGAEDYGIYNVVGGVVGMLSFLNSSMALATGRFLSYAIGRENSDLLTDTYSASIVLHFIVSLIIVLLAETLGIWYFYNYLNIPEDSYGDAMWIYQLSILSTFISINSVPIISLVTSHEDMQAYAYISLLEGLLKLGVAFLLLFNYFDNLKAYAILMFMTSVIVLSVWRIYSLNKYKSCKFKFKVNKSIFIEIYGFVSWQIVGSISWVLRNQGINLVLNFFFGPLLNTARTLANQVNGGITSAVSAFQTATNPQIVKNYAKEDLESMHLLLYRSSKLAFLMLFVFALPIICEANEVLKFWLGNIPEYAVIFVQLMIVATLIDSLSGTLQQAALATGKIRRYTGIVTTILLSDIVWVILAFKAGLPPQSMLYIESAIYFVVFIARLIILRKMVSLPVIKFLLYVTLPEFLVATIAFVLVAILYMFHLQNLGLILKLAILFCSACLVSICFGLNKSERIWALNILKGLVLKLKKNG